MTILLSLMQSEKQVRLERLSLLISLSNYSRKSATEITKIFGFTEFNNRINLVSINYLLVDYLLLCRSNLVNRNRDQSMGVY